MDASHNDAEDPFRRIERLIHEGFVAREQVEHAREVWSARGWADGIAIPNGGMVIVHESDLLHVVVVPRILRVPMRIEYMLAGIFELRTAEHGRMAGLSRWEEAGSPRFGIVVIDPDMRLRTMFVVDARRIGKAQRKGALIWKQ